MSEPRARAFATRPATGLTARGKEAPLHSASGYCDARRRTAIVDR
ncbi:hypothetical protein BURMUCF1_B0448 [Burkholderia multivorans ATCC BAA-247]|nr:hypothetical protein BURMUCGD2M_6626 [Burkholderia multivorans CGD2M]EJO59773.1 hypothetical protein BURMUCF1_B0448 [Burkholderia multivorans ATCC BAA-247]